LRTPADEQCVILKPGQQLSLPKPHNYFYNYSDELRVHGM